MSNDIDHLTEWQAYVKRTGLVIWQGKTPEQMTDEECMACLQYIRWAR